MLKTPGKPHHILLVDDDDIDREQIQRFLGQGHQFTEAASVSEAKTCLTSLTFDAAIIDYRLPDGTGLDLIDDLADIDVPIILVTGMGTERIAADALKQGCLEYLSKDDLSQESLRIALAYVLEKTEFQRVLRDHQTTLRSHAVELESVNRELTLFAATVAHDLLEPMNTIHHAADKAFAVSQNHAALTKELCPQLAAIRSECARVSHMVNRLLDYTRIDRKAVTVSEVPLAEVITAVIHSLQSGIETTGSEIKYPDLPVIRGDRVLLHQLFQNLIANSIQHARGKPAKIMINCKSSQPQLPCELSISDDGPGMSPSQLQELQQRLANDDAATIPLKQGGIGLEICRKVVAKLRGHLEIRSALGIGTAVKITLPQT